MADWAKIKAEYISDPSMSYRKLAEKYGLSRGTLQKAATAEGWPKMRSQKGAKTVSKIVDACATKEAKKACKEIEAAGMLLDKLIEGIIGIEPDDLERLYTAASVLQKIKDSKKGLTEKDLEEQEARIAKLRREAEREDEDKGIEFVVPDELKRFCR